MGINISNVVYSYSKDKNNLLFDKINFTFKTHNEFIALIGHTGSGKSTLSQMLNAIILPDQGSIEINNQIIKAKGNKNLKKIRKEIGLVLQFPEYQLFEETVLKDVMFGPSNYKELKKDAKEYALNALESLNVTKDIYDRPPFNLSGGQKRKVAIAGVLAINPKVLILDEPTVGLDPKAKLELMQVLKNLNEVEHKSIIIITHDMNVVANYAKRVVVLNEGRITFDGTPHALFQDKDVLLNNHLELPYISKIAEGLKAEGYIKYNEIPITIDELHQIIVGEDHE